MGIGYVFALCCIILAYLAGREPAHSMAKAMTPQPMTMAHPMSPTALPHQPMAMEMGYSTPASPAYQRHSGNLAPVRTHDGRMMVY
jgi:putative hemolysin